MKKILVLAFVLLVSAFGFGQALTFAGGGGRLKTDASTGVISSTAVSLSLSDGSSGSLEITLPAIGTGDLQNGGCFLSGGAFTLKTTSPTNMVLKGTLGPNSGSCPNGPEWQLGYEGSNYYTYTLAFTLSDGAFQINCVLRTAYINGRWDGTAQISYVDGQF